MHNATVYYVSFFATDIPAGSVVFNYTIYINLASSGNLLGIFLSFLRSSTAENILVFDNGLQTKNYFFFSSIPSSYSVTNDIATVRESVIFRGRIPYRLYPPGTNTLSFDVELSITTQGLSSSFEHRTLVVAEVIGRYYLAFTYISLLPHLLCRSMSQDIVLKWRDLYCSE